MKSFKLSLVALTSLGLSFLASCNNSQQVNDPANSPSVLASKADTGGAIEPNTHTGTARITLKAAAPLKIGKSTLMLNVTDANGKPLAAKNVTVQMVMTAKEMTAMGMDGMGAGSAKTEVKPGSEPEMFEVQTSLPFGGNWELKVDLKDAQPSSAVFGLAVK